MRRNAFLSLAQWSSTSSYHLNSMIWIVLKKSHCTKKCKRKWKDFVKINIQWEETAGQGLNSIHTHFKPLFTSDACTHPPFLLWYTGMRSSIKHGDLEFWLLLTILVRILALIPWFGARVSNGQLLSPALLWYLVEVVAGVPWLYDSSLEACSDSLDWLRGYSSKSDSISHRATLSVLLCGRVESQSSCGTDRQWTCLEKEKIAEGSKQFYWLSCLAIEFVKLKSNTQCSVFFFAVLVNFLAINGNFFEIEKYILPVYLWTVGWKEELGERKIITS